MYFKFLGHGRSTVDPNAKPDARHHFPASFMSSVPSQFEDARPLPPETLQCLRDYVVRFIGASRGPLKALSLTVRPAQPGSEHSRRVRIATRPPLRATRIVFSNQIIRIEVAHIPHHQHLLFLQD